MSMFMRWSAVLLLIGGLFTIAPARGRAAQKPHGAFWGASIGIFELGGTGKVYLTSGDADFDIKALDAVGLVQDPQANLVGFGWDNNQLPGLRLTYGYRHSWRWTTHADLFWAFSKSAEQSGQVPDALGVTYVHKENTEWQQKGVRLMVDFVPFEPLQLWYFTGGFEYTWINTRLEFQFQQNNASGPSTRWYSSFGDNGSAIGVVLGSGITFPSQSGKSVGFIAVTYAYSPLSGDLYAWEANNIQIGGLSLDAGYRFYLGGKK